MRVQSKSVLPKTRLLRAASELEGRRVHNSLCDGRKLTSTECSRTTETCLRLNPICHSVQVYATGRQRNRREPGGRGKKRTENDRLKSVHIYARRTQTYHSGPEQSVCVCVVHSGNGAFSHGWGVRPVATGSGERGCLLFHR